MVLVKFRDFKILLTALLTITARRIVKDEIWLRSYFEQTKAAVLLSNRVSIVGIKDYVQVHLKVPLETCAMVALNALLCALSVRTTVFLFFNKLPRQRRARYPMIYLRRYG